MGILAQLRATIARGLGLTDPRLAHYFSGGPSWAGESVSVETAMQLDVVWACVRLISQTIATLPLLFYTRDAGGRGEVDRSHSLYRILHDRPNADMTATEYWEAVAASVLLWGNSYSAIERNAGGITAITPMRPDRVTVRREPDGSLSYTYSWQGQVSRYSEDDIFHVKGFSLDGLMGISPVAQARQVLGTATAAEKVAASFFRNGMRPSAVMIAPTYLTTQQRADSKAYVEGFTGSLNAGRVPLLEGGWDIKTLSLPPDDAQLLATRSFQVAQICRWFDVPPVMIGHMEKSTAWGTGLEQMMLWFLTFSLRPHLKRIEQAIGKTLLKPAEQQRNYAEFNLDGLLRADSAARAALYSVYAQNGLRTRNEIRALDNLPPLPGGDDLTVQSNLLPIDRLGEVPPSEQTAPNPGSSGPTPTSPVGKETQ